MRLAKQPELRIDPHVAQWIVQACTRLLATFAVFQGVFIVLGGADRWQSRGLAVAMSVPGAPQSWGYAILGAGLLTLVGTLMSRMVLTALASVAIGTWCLFFAVSLFIVTIRDPRVATTGVITYGTVALLSCTLAVPYWQSRRD